jgi:type IV pilus assembly protein PilQ
MKTIRYWIVAAAIVAGTTLVGVGAAPQAPTAGTEQGLRAFSTSPIDVDYQSANLRTVLRQLAEIGGVNLIIDPSVPSDAAVDLKLAQVPWFQVMDVVLRSGQLTYQLDGTIVRVLTQKALTDEYSAETLKRSAMERAPDLETARIRLNYASAKDIAQLLGALGFGKKETAAGGAATSGGGGSVQAEERTNMLVVQETPKNLAEIREIVADLDRAEPQVEIEARIVQTQTSAIRNLGVNWNASSIADAALGNTSKLAFPNNGRLDANVNPGEADPSNGVKLALGAINGAFNLDVTLSALEQNGLLKVISRPRITTQNNKEAEVTQGVEIPYQVINNVGGTATTSIQFKDAALKLLVTPKITAANTVIMNIQLENASPGKVLGSEQAGPSISTDRARTEVQVADGSTTVIGGILQTSDESTDSRTPGLGRLPLLGWLFRNNSSNNRTQELLIFITPRIIRG